MKKMLYLMAAVLLVAGCRKQEGTSKVRVHVNDFTITEGEFPTRGEEPIADYVGVKAIDLAFYEGSTEVYKHTQLRDDPSTYTTFGSFECDLPIGNFTLVVVGRGFTDGDVFVLTSPTSAGYTSERPRETFCATQEVTVNNTVQLEVSVTLSRIIAKLNILSTDPRTASVTKIRTTYGAGGKSFSPTTGLATVNTGFSVTNTPGYVGETLNVNNYAFLATDEQTMDITLEALDADQNVLFTKVVPNVPLRRNRITTLIGQVFTTDASAATFKVESDWLEGNEVPF